MRISWFLGGGLGVAMSVVVSAPTDGFLAVAREKFGADGEKAARFLAENMPTQDRVGVSTEFLTENLELAFKARSEFPWSKGVPEEIFLNDVLPYAVFDEPRDPWRAEFYQLAREVVKDARTATEAAQALNHQWFNLVKVHYHTGRKRPNQSPKESKELGMATCTGLTIILVDACRAVGIPARGVGTPMWVNERGNHTWVEIWDGEWRFTGADEYDLNGLNRGWFVSDAAQAKADVARYSIYATSWKREGLAFPMVWALDSDAVAAVNVTARYAQSAASDTAQAKLGVRLLEKSGGPRLLAQVRATDRTSCAIGGAETKAGTSDFNDLLRLALRPGVEGWLRFTVGSETRELAYGPLAPGDSTVDAVWSDLAPVSPTIAALETWLALPRPERSVDAPILKTALSKIEATHAISLLAADRLSRLAVERKDEFEKKSLIVDGKTLRWLEKTFGAAPPEGRSLWISMHGGGNAPVAVNDKQWQNQIGLYEPAEGVYVAPRAPTDTWNLWHESHIDPLFQRLIDDFVALAGVNPNKVYLMGYSAGGDGVWQLAPRMADRFAAAAMMAGHPNEASLLGLRNVPFAILMGGDDSAYNRNKVATERATELDQLEKDDPTGYVHLSRIYPGLGHWMEHKDAEALPWMAKFRRKTWPQKVVWLQDDVLHHEFYWLSIPERTPVRERQKIVATVQDHTISLEGDVPSTLSLRLSDELLSLDEPIKVVVKGREVFSGQVTRTAADIVRSLDARADVSSAATASVRWE